MATDSFKQTRLGIDQVNMGYIYDIVYAGALDFQPLGQSLPNEEKVKNEIGTRAFLNIQVGHQRWAFAHRLAGQIFTAAQEQSLFDLVEPDIDRTAVMTAGHEFGEPLFQTENLEQALGPKNTHLLNEDLAMLSISVPLMNEYQIFASRVGLDTLVRHTMYLLGTYLRYIAVARGADHLHAYYEGMAMQGLRRMLESGIIYHDPVGPWHVNAGYERVIKFFALNQNDLDLQVKICETGNTDLAKNYLGRAAATENDPRIQDLIHRVTTARDNV